MFRELNFVNIASKRAFLALPKSIQQQFASDILAIQEGRSSSSYVKDHSMWIGAGAFELIHKSQPVSKAVCCLKHLNRIYVLHAYAKTGKKLSPVSMKIARLRYKAVLLDKQQPSLREDKTP